MVRHCIVGTFVALLIGVVVAAQESSGERRFSTDGRTLAEQVRATDRRVVIPINASEPAKLAPPKGVSWERFRADVSDIVLLLRVQSVRPRLAYRADMDANAAEFSPKNLPASEGNANWIVSTIRARVDGVLKGGPALKEGVELLFEEDGGTETIRGVQVTAVVPWLTPMVEGKRYLVFGELTQSGRLLRVAVYEEPSPSGWLTSAGPQKNENDPLETLGGAEQALAHLENEMRK